jgi:hypothetical protein
MSTLVFGIENLMARYANTTLRPELPQGYSHPGQWIEDLMQDQDLVPREVEEKTAAFGRDYRIERSYLARILSNKREITSVGHKKLEALRVALRRDRSEWQRRLGIEIPNAAKLEPASFLDSSENREFQFASLTDAHESDVWRKGDVFSAYWDSHDGWIVLMSNELANWLTPNPALPTAILTVDPNAIHHEVQIGVYGIRDSETVLLSMFPIEGRQAFAYRHTNDTKIQNPLSVVVDQLEYMGRVIQVVFQERSE